MNQEQKPVIEKITPVGFRVLLRIYKKDSMTTSGLELPDSENSGMPVMAQITVLGKKTFWQRFLMSFGFKPEYKVGDWVYFRKYSVDELRVSTSDGELILFVLEENEIIGIVNEE